ncbi:MAG: ATP synthase F1 subunit gamma [Flavobacteriales bacterium]|nr:ATP synthase F1 subunit gamma [Flavobacteriales bacterium]|tara:strand:+ start:775 stop:1629 length:855 start_codon:yes stop_codon:yes gene_type:complete
MANLKEIRARITSVGSTMQITSAMKMVSAAKLKRAQDAITQMRPYANKLNELLVNLSSTLDTSKGGVYSQAREVKSILIVAVTSNRGLCGAFNNNVIKGAKAIAEDYEHAAFLTIGKKASEHFTKNGYEVIASHDNLYNNLSFTNTSVIAHDLMNYFLEGTYDKVVVVYNQFKNAASQNLITEAYLPVETPAEDTATISDYIFEPEKEEIVAELIPKSLKVQLFKAVLDSHASEHGARMTAMHKATDNAGELKRELTLTYNKARQAAITGEILEIVGGAEALNN